MNIVMNEFHVTTLGFAKVKANLFTEKVPRKQSKMEILSERGKACLVIVLVNLQRKEK